ncbi:MAG TPA: cytochrome d ubiquinol oxidase subunit II, partial [Bryobacteraceae bacterium]|nr:cytochrome d ubiquinol oxidase subunit II [Bryobacteraceae bacterium]
FRNHIESRVWQPFWDVVFGGASALLVIFFGAALGNVVRGVPLDREGFFFLPLWTNFQLGKDVGILDWYTVIVGLAAFVTLTVHGALWVALRTSGSLEHRARRVARRVWWAVLVATILITLLSFRIQPHLRESFDSHPWGYIFPFLALLGLIGMQILNTGPKAMAAFLSSSLFIVGMLTSAAFGVFPYVLPSNSDPSLGLTVYNASAAPYGLKIGLFWFIPGMILTATYFTYTYRSFSGKVGE